MNNDDIKFCPYCGKDFEIVKYMDGKCKCEYCDALFYVMEHENSKRKGEVENDDSDHQGSV